MKYVIATLLALLFSCGGGGGSETTTTPSTPTGGGDTTTPPPPPPPPPEPVIEVDIVKDNGDRFDPVLIDITSDEEYTYTTTIGRVMPTETGIAIYSDGQLGTGILVINDDDEYQFEIVEEPVCEGTYDGLPGGVKIDCEGYQVRSGTPWYIYYGKEDTRIVQWEILYIGGVRTLEPEKPVEPDAFLIKRAEDTIEAANEKFRQWGVHVELVLVGVAGYQTPNSGTVVNKYIEDGTLPNADIIAVQGALPAGLCGQAGQSNRFRTRTQPLRFLNGCGLKTWLHEMGHSVGLGHGENFGVNPGSGSHFFFAQGGNMCGYRSDIMQYNGSDSEKAFSNHTVTCGQMYDLNPENQYYEDMAGSDDYGGPSTGYAINRVRYDVSLVHDENSVVPKAVLDIEPEEEIIIID